MNNITEIYIESSLICDQSQLSSSIRLEMASKNIQRVVRLDRARSRNLANFRKNRRRIITLINNAFGVIVKKCGVYQNGSLKFFETMPSRLKFRALSRGAIIFYVSLLV